MTLRYKILMPFAILLACGALVIHFYWLPQYERYSVEQARQSEQKHLSLLATGMTSDLLAGDLAKIHNILANMMAGHSELLQLELRDKNGFLLFPLEKVDFSQASKINLLSQNIVHKEQTIGSIKAEVNIEAQITTRTRLISELELLLMLALIGASLVGVLMQLLGIKLPLDRLAEGLSRVSRGDYDVLVPPPPKR